jgi:hypothetical protein
MDLLAKMSADPSVQFVDSLDERTQWDTHESTDEYYGEY